MDQECQAALAEEQRLRSGVVAEGNYLMPSARAVDKRSNPTFKVRTGDSSKVRSSSCALLEQP